MREDEPLSHFKVLIGVNSRGSWVAQDQNGLFGGLFVSRDEAVKFALFENGRRRDAVVMVSGTLELDPSAKPFAPTPAPLQQVA